MADSFEFNAELRVEWQPDYPKDGRPSRSCSFYFRDQKWHFEMIEGNRSYPSYTISLHFEGRDEDMPDRFKVGTILISKDGVMQFGAMSYILSGRSHDLWSFAVNNESIEVPETRIAPKLKLAFLFVSPRGQPSYEETIILTTLGDQDFPVDLDTLSEDFAKLLLEKADADVELVCGERKFSAHRLVLAARSKVFASMFRNKMSDRETSVVDVADFDVAVIDIFLGYVYSGRVQGVSEKTAPGLYAAAAKYALSGLKNACSDWMVKRLTEENCINFLNTANDHGDGPFKDEVLSFIRNHEAVRRSEGWKRYSEKQRK